MSESPIDIIARDCIAVRVRKLNRVVTGIYDDALRPHGLRSSQMNILVVVTKLGTARPAQVCEILDLDASTLSRNVDRMITAGWLEVVSDDDARSQPLRITKQGTALLNKVVPAWRQAQQHAETMLGESGVSALGRVMKQLARAATEG